MVVGGGEVGRWHCGREWVVVRARWGVVVGVGGGARCDRVECWNRRTQPKNAGIRNFASEDPGEGWVGLSRPEGALHRFETGEYGSQHQRLVA